MSLNSGHFETKHIDSESIFTRPGKLFAEMFKDIFESGPLSVMLAVRDLKAQYRQSFLGIVWAFIPPIVWAVGLTVAKSNAFINIDSPKMNYTAFVMISISLWQIFSAALTGPLISLNTNRALLTRVAFPREVIIMSDVLKQLFTVLINLLVIIAAFVWFQVPVGWSSLLAIPAMLLMVLLGTAFGILLAPIGLLYRDISSALPIVMMMWMAFTPVLYPLPPFAGFFATTVRWNPVTPMLVTVRELVADETLTVFPQFVAVTVGSLVILILGMALLRSVLPVICERWGA